MPDPVGAVLSVHGAVPAGVEIVILGGLAANAYRTVPRVTLDADLLLVTDLRSAGPIERALKSAGFTRPKGRRVYRAGRFEWRRLLWPFPDPDDPTLIDLFFSGADPHSAVFIRSVAARAIATMVGGRPLHAATPEDVVVFKALAIASGARGPKEATDADDIASIVRNPALSLDRAYIRKMASSVGVLRVVNRFLK
ncbi:MAG: hypothetical protein HY721_24785 [Planctomycetes bacterium]|nr:hypothetical protein [Planctomycetota bacterium]